MDLSRRRLLQLSLASLASSAVAQQGKVFRIGIVGNSFPAADLAKRTTELPAPRLIAQGLRELGWIEGVNIQTLWRTVEGRYERFPEVIGELVQSRVDLIVVFSSNAARIAMEKTRTIPIVHASYARLIDEKLVSNLSRPGGNLTGMSADGLRGLNGKRLALLKAAAPRVTRVALVRDFIPSREVPEPTISKETESALRTTGLAALLVHFEHQRDMAAAIEKAVRNGANGMLVLQWPYIHYRQTQIDIHELAIRHRVPTMYSTITAAESGGLMAYDADFDLDRRIPRFIDKILRGAKAGDIPIEQPQKFDFVINQAAAKAIGLAIPAAVLAQADRVIEAARSHLREIISPPRPGSSVDRAAPS